MTKSEFEHLLSRAGEIAHDSDFFLIGSQALRGTCAAIPRDFPITYEADLYPKNHPQAWGLLRAQLGNKSKFFNQNGYYLDCTDPGLANLPDGWIERLIPFRTPRTGGVTAWCLDPNDLFASKLSVWRDKDQQFLRAMLRHKLAKVKIIESRIEELPVSESHRTQMKKLTAELVKELKTTQRNARKK